MVEYFKTYDPVKDIGMFDDKLLFIADTKTLYKVVGKTTKTLRVKRYPLQECVFQDISVVFETMGLNVFYLQWNESELFGEIQVIKGWSKFENMFLFEAATFPFEKVMKLEHLSRYIGDAHINFVSDMDEDIVRMRFDTDVGCLRRCWDLSNGLSKDYYKPFFINYLQKVKRHPRYEELIQKYPYALHIIGMMNERMPITEHNECPDCLNHQHSEEEPPLQLEMTT